MFLKNLGFHSQKVSKFQIVKKNTRSSFADMFSLTPNFSAIGHLYWIYIHS